MRDLLEAGAMVVERNHAVALLKTLSEQQRTEPEAGLYQIAVQTIVGEELLLVPGGSAMLNLMEDLVGAVEGQEGQEGAYCFDITALDGDGAPAHYMFGIVPS